MSAKKLNVKVNRKLRRLGSAQNIGPLSALNKVGGEQLTLEFKRAYHLYIQTGSKQSLKRYDSLQNKMLELVEQLPRKEREACYSMLYAHHIAVLYRDPKGGALEGILDVTKWYRNISDPAAAKAAYRLKEVQKVQAAASGLAQKMGNAGSYKPYFQQGFQKFIKTIPLDDEELLGVFEDIRKYCKNHKKSDNRNSYLNRLQGRLFEKYVEHSKLWRNEFSKRMKEAQQIADEMGNGWDVEDVVGDLSLLGNHSFKDAWDAAIIIKNENTKQAFLFTAAQFKAEKRLKGLKQTKNDALWRETDAVSPHGRDRSAIPTILRFKKGDKELDYQLIPSPNNDIAYRYVVHTSNTIKPSKDESSLENFGISVQTLVSDVTSLEMRAIADALVSAVYNVW